MLQIDKMQLIQGVTVYGDDRAPDVFYLLPQQPSYRIDNNGNPVFKFLKYRFPVDRGDGVEGGGFIIFDVEFAVPQDKVDPIKQELSAQAGRPAKIGTITYTDGEAKVNVLNENGDLVESVFNPGQPSLFGNNITPFGVELTPEGATLAEQALQGRGGLVQVAYSLTFLAKLPPLEVTAGFQSSQFYSFFQTIDLKARFWARNDYREELRESLIQAEAMHVDIDPGGFTDRQVIEEVRDWAFSTLESRVEKMMVEELTPVPDDQRDRPSGVRHLIRDVQKTRINSFTLRFTERATEPWDVHPQGTLPNITSLTDGSGNPIQWDDFAADVDLDDPFFHTKRVDVYVNADFKNLPIHSVEVKANYRGRPMTSIDGGTRGEARFDDATKVAKFAEFVKDDDWDFTYSYTVNYKGSSRIFESEEKVTDESVVTVGVDDVGILLVEVAAGDINWSDVESAQVRLTYEDPGEGVGPIEDQFRLTESEPAHRFERVIFAPFRKTYRYRVRYFMTDGKEYETEEHEGRAHHLFINDPFTARKTVKVVGVADFDNAVDNIFVDLQYVDEDNDYRLTHSITLNATSPFLDWAFPVIDADLGKVTYSGNVLLKGGGGVRPIEPATTDAGTILVPRAPLEHLKVELVTDLLDFITVIKLVRVQVTYTDDENLVSVNEDVIFSETRSETAVVTIPIFDLARKTYTWSAEYFMADSSRHEVGPTESSDTVVILEVPS